MIVLYQSTGCNIGPLWDKEGSSQRVELPSVVSKKRSVDRKNWEIFLSIEVPFFCAAAEEAEDGPQWRLKVGIHADELRLGGVDA